MTLNNIFRAVFEKQENEEHIHSKKSMHVKFEDKKQTIRFQEQNIS